MKEIKTEFLFFSLVEVAGLLILCLYFVDVRFTFCSHFVHILFALEEISEIRFVCYSFLSNFKANNKRVGVWNKKSVLQESFCFPFYCSVAKMPDLWNRNYQTKLF